MESTTACAGSFVTAYMLPSTGYPGYVDVWTQCHRSSDSVEQTVEHYEGLTLGEAFDVIDATWATHAHPRPRDEGGLEAAGGAGRLPRGAWSAAARAGATADGGCDR